MQKYFISMMVPGMAFNGESLDHQSLGGSETAGLQMAFALARLKHSVRLFCNCQSVHVKDGVQFIPVDMWGMAFQSAPTDIAIVQRTPEPFMTPGLSKLNILWAHDLPSARLADRFRGGMWNIDNVFVLSEFMRARYEKVVQLNKQELFVTRNGIDLSLRPNEPVTRDLKQLVYSARPERGLDVLLDKIFPELLKRDHEYKLTIYGYDNPVDHMRDFYAACHQRIDALPNCNFGGTLNKRDLYKAYSGAGVYVYPTPSPTAPEFAEISCISIMEAQMCGLPVVTTDVGALPETLHGEAGRIVAYEPVLGWSDNTIGDFCGQIEGLQDASKWEHSSLAGQKHAASLSWDAVAEEWTERFTQELVRFNDDPVRLAHHLYRRSDIFAAKAALEGAEGEAAYDLRDTIARDYAFAESHEALVAHYTEYGKTTDAHLTKQLDLGNINQDLIDNNQEQRFHRVADVIEANPGISSVYDHGCGHGWSTMYLANRFAKTGRKMLWKGVDIDPGAIIWAKKIKDKFADDPVGVTFATKSGNKIYDAAICMDVLEHCIDPVAELQKVESRVKKDGLVIITVPFGPSEYGTNNWVNFKNHLWEFDSHDINDMLEKKTGLTVSVCPDHPNAATGEPVGFHLIVYKADHEPIGAIDMDRKLRLQRPRNTLSVNIVAGPGAEKTLEWCLSSVGGIADEIIIADTGMNPLALAIADTHPNVTIIPGSNPLEHGFETPRNEALAASSMDFVLWIDTDERLLMPSALTKYLRSNRWNGYSLRQNHFTVDGDLKVDLPVRLFRRNGKMRFFGMIHEHPEEGLNEGPGHIVVTSDIHIAHVGYLDEPTRRERFARNTPLMIKDREKYPDRLLQKFFIMRDDVLMARYLAEANGGRLTAEAHGMLQEVKDLYRKHFAGGCKYMGVEPMPYYTEALAMLGEGVEVTFDVSAQRDGIGDQLNGGTRMRFATLDEAKVELSNRLEQKIEPLMKEHW